MQRDQAEGRLEPLIRALDNFFNRYFAMLFQFMKVHYTEEHWQSIAGDDGTFDYVMMQRDRLADGMDVYVKSGTMLPLDDSRLANVAVKLASMDRISNLDLFNLLKLPDAEEMVQNLVKEKIDPTLLVKNMQEDEGDRTAFMDYEVIKAGKYAPPREDPEAGHIDTHREQMMRDEYTSGTDAEGNIVWDADKRAAFVAHVRAEMDSLQRRADVMQKQVDANEALNTPALPAPLPGQTDIEAPAQPMPGMPGQMPAPDGGQPPMPPQAPAAPMPAAVAPTPDAPAPMLPPQ